MVTAYEVDVLRSDEFTGADKGEYDFVFVGRGDSTEEAAAAAQDACGFADFANIIDYAMQKRDIDGDVVVVLKVAG